MLIETSIDQLSLSGIDIKVLCFLFKIPVKVKTPVSRADNNRNDSSTANCEATHATQEVSTALLYSRVRLISL